jgi:hypothetical protein
VKDNYTTVSFSVSEPWKFDGRHLRKAESSFGKTTRRRGCAFVEIFINACKVRIRRAIIRVIGYDRRDGWSSIHLWA